MSNSGKFLTGKVALVTGAGRGIGRAYAERLASLGAAVAVHDISQEAPSEYGEASSLAAVASEIADLGAPALAVTADLTNRDAVFQMVEKIREDLGPIAILVNNAGGDIAAKGGKAQPNDAVFISDEDAQAIIDRNLRTCILTCQAVAPMMIQSRWGRIITIGSVVSFRGSSGGAMYAVAKAAVLNWTRCLAAQLRPHNVTVNMIAPGNTPTERFKATRKVDDEWLAKQHCINILDRPCSTADLANVLEFFVSDLATFVSGQAISVDGGQRLWPG